MAIEDKGFVDTFRAVYPGCRRPSPASPGRRRPSPPPRTTTTTASTSRSPGAKDLQVISAGIVGEKAPEADIVVTPWPSDHRATMAKVKF